MYEFRFAISRAGPLAFVGDGGLPEISARENDALADRESHVCKAVAPGGATPLDFSSNIVRSSCACGRVAEAPGFQPGYAGSIPATRSSDPSARGGLTRKSLQVRLLPESPKGAP